MPEGWGPSYHPPPHGYVSNIRSFYDDGYEDGFKDGEISALRRGRRAREEGIREAQSPMPEAVTKVKRKRNKWNLFLKRFKFRKKRPRESSKAYFRLRTKAASRAYKRKKK